MTYVLTRTAVRIVVALVALLLMATAAPARADRPGPAIIEVPVRFDVVNVNRSKVLCPTDGGQYEMVGHLVAPVDALDDPSPAVTIYLPGAVSTERMAWRQKAGGGDYDVARGMAARGHISITLDRLSMGNSGVPNGFLHCLGGEAAAVDQVTDQLRAGGYRIDGREPVAFDRIALAGHSYGGFVASTTALSFHGVDAVLLIASAADQLAPVGFLTGLVEEGVAECGHGGFPKREGGPGGYATLLPIHERIWGEVDPDVKTDYIGRAERESCGQLSSLGPALLASRLLAHTVDVPMLFVAAENDWIFPPDRMRAQQRLFRGSPDSTYVEIANAGHMLIVEQGLADGSPASRRVQDALSDWLTPRGF